MVAMASWVSVPVRPCPGKCLVQAATPALCRPATAAAVCRATRPVSAPNERVPTAGLSAVPSTSAHGARSKLIPSAARSAPVERYTAWVRAMSSTAPRAALPGTGLPSAYATRVTSPPSSSIAITGSWSAAAARSAAVSALHLARSRDVLPEQGDAGQAPAECVEHPAGSGRAGERRDEDRVGQASQHRVRRPDVRVLAHPFTAPATRPLVMRRWTMRKKTITGIVKRVEAAMIDPQSTVPRP